MYIYVYIYVFFGQRHKDFSLTITYPWFPQIATQGSAHLPADGGGVPVDRSSTRLGTRTQDHYLPLLPLINSYPPKWDIPLQNCIKDW